MIRYYIEMKPTFDSYELYKKIQTHDANVLKLDDKIQCHGKVNSFRELSYILYWCMLFSNNILEMSIYNERKDKNEKKEGP